LVGLVSIPNRLVVIVKFTLEVIAIFIYYILELEKIDIVLLPKV
jgi:hypothetical protein